MSQNLRSTFSNSHRIKYIVLKYLPFYYYLDSRYEDNYSRFSYIVKYFGTYLLLVSLLIGIPDLQQITSIALIFLSFYNTYEFFIYWNDIIDLPEHRTAKFLFKKEKFYLIKLIWFIALKFSLWLLLDQDQFYNCLILETVLALVFVIHNTIYVFKPLTFYLLYFLKGFIFFIPFVFDEVEIQYYFWYVILFNLSYIPRYMVRKFAFLHRGNKTLYKRFFYQAIIYKNLLVGVLGLFNPLFFIVLIYIDVLTVLEFIIRKVKEKNGE